MMMKPIADDRNLKLGLTGLLRVKNDGEFLERCILSCIEALDELIIVWNDCSDNSAQEIDRLSKLYPDKIKAFEYPYKIYALGLSHEEFQYADSLPEDSPNLLCNYYNYCLSKVSYQYAIKIDADQIYNTEKLKSYQDLIKSNIKQEWKSIDIIGALVHLCMKINKRGGIFFNHTLSFFNFTLPPSIRLCYIHFINLAFLKYSWSLSFSGINVFYYKNEGYVPLGGISERINILPPYNGTGDHLLFKVTKDCYYKKYISPMYNKLKSNDYSIIETFVCPQKEVLAGFLWYHISMERESIRNVIENEVKNKPSIFLRFDTFIKLKYKDVLTIIDTRMFAPATQTLFQNVYMVFKDELNNIIKHN